MSAVNLSYRPAGVVLVRATTDPGDLELPEYVEFATAGEENGLRWLEMVWARTDVREALSMASPSLAARITQILDDRADRSARETHRAVMSAATYLLRWQRRSTPFGLFAGVGQVRVGPTAEAAVGSRHRPVIRPDAQWLAAHVGRLEQHPALRARVSVTVNSTGYLRDGRFVVPGKPGPGTGQPEPAREVSVRLSRPVRTVLAAAMRPVRIDALVGRLRAEFPSTSLDRIEALLHGLIEQHVLLTSLWPSMTAVDGLSHVIAEVRAGGGAAFADLAPLLADLEEVAGHIARHNSCADSRAAYTIRRTTANLMRPMAPACGQVLAVDVSLDARVTLPDSVLREAAAAAEVLVRLSTAPFGGSAWTDYHARFRARYGPAALVPVRELLSDAGLGYPAGYLGTARARPAWRILTERDAALMSLIQQRNLGGGEEIELTETTMRALTVGDHTDVIAPQRVEVGFEVHAASTNDIDRGRYQLWVTAVPRPQSSMAGRFAYLLDEAGRTALAASYQADDEDAVAVQLSFPPRRVRNENVVRAPAMVAHTVCLAEHPDPRSAGVEVVEVDDLAVTADAEQMFLIQRSTGRRVIPRVPHALDAYQQTPPLARFLAEVADARTAIWRPFDFGAARTLPYTPRVRHRRAVLAPARWMLNSADLPSPREELPAWERGLDRWLERWRVPRQVELCQGELRLPLDLDHRLDRLQFRTRLERSGRVELREVGAPSRHGWIGRPAQFLLPLTLAVAQRRRPPPVTVPPAAVHYPGDAGVLHAVLPGNPARFDDILTAHCPRLAADLGDTVGAWWVGRHRDLIQPEGEQHLALYLRLASPGQYGKAAAQLADFARRLQAAGLPAQLSLSPYHPQTGRYGDGHAMAAAEQVFAADTVAALAQIAVAAAAGLPGQALAAASMARIAAAFAPNPDAGCRSLLHLLPHQPAAVDRTLRDQAMQLADPASDYHAIRELPGGDRVAAAWQHRDHALSVYFDRLREQREPATVLRSLLHDHHVRALGIDPQFERGTNRLVRAITQRRLATASGAR
jgi:lantibiotic biosynthesis protein